MESFKANILIFIFIAVAGGLGYWAIQSLKENSDSLNKTYYIDDVGPVVTSEPSGVPVTQEPIATPTTPTPEPEPPTSTPSNGTHATLIADIQDLIDDKVLMKKGSKGTRVGVVQKFLIAYGIKISADNDYGDSTVNGVKKFQTDQKISADGQTGEGTYKKMIEWLEAN